MGNEQNDCILVAIRVRDPDPDPDTDPDPYYDTGKTCLGGVCTVPLLLVSVMIPCDSDRLKVRCSHYARIRESPVCNLQQTRAYPRVIVNVPYAG